MEALNGHVRVMKEKAAGVGERIREVSFFISVTVELAAKAERPIRRTAYTSPSVVSTHTFTAQGVTVRLSNIEGFKCIISGCITISMRGNRKVLFLLCWFLESDDRVAVIAS
jgi:hypothetical protein